MVATILKDATAEESNKQRKRNTPSDGEGVLARGYLVRTAKVTVRR